MNKKSKKKYWEEEDPEILCNKALKVKHYEENGALQLRMRTRINGKTVVKSGVNLRKHILKEEPELLEALANIFTDWFNEYLEEKKQEEDIE